MTGETILILAAVFTAIAGAFIAISGTRNHTDTDENLGD